MQHADRTASAVSPVAVPDMADAHTVEADPVGVIDRKACFISRDKDHRMDLGGIHLQLSLIHI